MVFRSKTYSVLVVCESEQFNSKIDSLLPGSDYFPLDKAVSLQEARRKALSKAYDICIVNSRSAVSESAKLAEDLCGKTSTVCLLMVDRLKYDDVSSRLVDSGVACIPRQVTTEHFVQSVRMLSAFSERLGQEAKKRGSLEDKMKEIRQVNKAKWLLIEKEGLSEAEAQKHVERTAMNERISKLEAAERIIRKYSE